MKEEYLWDSSGSDPVVERLEATLQCLAYKEMPPPRLPARAATIERRAWFAIFDLRLAFALASIAVIGFGTYWMRSPTQRIVLDQADTIIEPVRPAIQSENTITHPEANIASPPPTRRKDVLTASVTPRQARPVPVRLVHTSTQRTAPIVVTKEEALAYNQLMLALSITSSKLKIVKDTVDGTEQKQSLFSRER